jgi:flagellar motor switch protein FliG
MGVLPPKVPANKDLTPLRIISTRAQKLKTPTSSNALALLREFHNLFARNKLSDAA